MLIRTSNNNPESISKVNDMQVVLMPDNWNDWYKWKTMFSVFVFTADGNHHELGSVKIASKGASGTEESPYRSTIPSQPCESLGPEFISLGQDENYYNTLKGMLDADRENFLKAMRDCAFDPSILTEFADEPVVAESLLRNVRSQSVTGRYHRLAHGNAAPTKFNFIYSLPYGSDTDFGMVPLKFEVEPESKPPTNVHVLIGRNAVGKTRALNLMIRALVSTDLSYEVGMFDHESPESIWGIDDSEKGSFANLISVSFSAFDKFGPRPTTKDGMTYHYVGLKKISEPPAQSDDLLLKTLNELAEEFSRSAENCRVGRRKQAWLKALETLESDPLFAEYNVTSLANLDGKSTTIDKAFFKELSSGHGIVLLIVTRLVELVEEQTLVLIDEPETHLHPPLLSAFVRAISSHLVDRNGVAIVATHSPVVLQEVPSNCVWKLTRSGTELKAERPEGETFGENVGTLTREVFGLEVAKSGFHHMLSVAVQDDYVNYESIVSEFKQHLGAEARSILRALLRNKNTENSENTE